MSTCHYSAQGEYSCTEHFAQNVAFLNSATCVKTGKNITEYDPVTRKNVTKPNYYLLDTRVNNLQECVDKARPFAGQYGSDMGTIYNDGAKNCKIIRQCGAGTSKSPGNAVYYMGLNCQSATNYGNGTQKCLNATF